MAGATAPEARTRPLEQPSGVLRMMFAVARVMRAEIGGGGTFGIDERFALAAWMSKPAPFFRV